MNVYIFSPNEMIKCLWRNKEIISASVKREVVGRYKGSVLGLLWSLFNPIFMIWVYTFVFRNIFRGYWNNESESKIEFALILFVGLIIFNFFSECINRAPSLIISNPNYVKKVVFPVEVLPFVGMLAALYHMGVSFSVWIIGYLLFVGIPHSSLLFLPLVISPLILIVMGLSWILSSLGVYLRDVTQVIGILTAALMFLSPVFYPMNALPPNYQSFMIFNPIAIACEITRNILFFGVGPDWILLLKYWICSLVLAWLGFAWFQKTRKGFADVI